MGAFGLGQVTHQAFLSADAADCSAAGVGPDVLVPGMFLGHRHRRGANLLIAVPDRRTPDVAPRFDPDTSPYSTDQDVIAVPLWPFRALSAMRAGADAATALLLLAGTAVADFGVHEALETYQAVPGRPVWDPHDSPHELAIEVRWRITDIVTQGWPVMKRT
ncbi:hypothetical protein [Nonomuraea wenchangensis]|uniref:hypothetical protein n=1 Tax=Nonomuraea wenchangensis TaxID=568860 RepID=UPI00340812A9